MPIYKVEAPDGKIYRLEGPEGSTPEQLSEALYSQVPDAATPFVKESGVLAGAKKGIEQLISQGKTVAGAVTGNANEAARAALERNKAMDQQYADQVSLQKIKDAYNKDGLLSAAGETASQIPLAIAEQLPNFAASFAGAKTGAMAGEKLGSALGARGRVIGGIGGGIAGAFAPSYVQSFGGNIERQAQEQEAAGKPIDINTGKAAATAVPQAVLDVASDRILLGGKMFGKMIGVPEKLLMQGGSEGLEKLAKERLFTTIAKGTATGIAGEVPTEVTQQALERYQAGLSLTDADALKEYGETAYQVALLGPLGAAGRLSEKGGARYAVQQKVMEEKRAADAAAAANAPKPPDITDPAYLQQIKAQYQEAEKRKADLKAQLRKVEDGSPTETADRLHNKEIEEQIKAMTPDLEELAKKYNEAAKVAPAFTPETAPGPVETPEAVKTPEAPKPALTVGDALDNPLGRFTKDELPPEAVAYIDLHRKNLGKPALNDYSIEDIRDAMPDSGIPGTQGTDKASKTQAQSLAKVDLNSLIAAKTGYTPDVTYKPEDIINVAKQKNIATDTDGFKFFLQRATGDNDLSKMEQPQLHSAFKALSELPKFDETQYLPEKTNAVHYSPEQYRNAVQKVSGLASEKDVPSSQALQVAKQATGLTRDSDAQLLLQNAYTNGDLNLSSKGDFITAQPAEQAEFKIEEGFAPATPTGFNVVRGDQVLYSTQNEDEAKAKVESLSKTADPAIKQIDKSIANERNTVAASQRSLDIMETAGLFRTPKYQQASAEHAALVQKANNNIQRLNEKKAYLQQPVTIQTTGKPSNIKTYKVKEKGVSEKAFNTREEALKHALENLPAARLNELAGKTKAPGFAKRLQAEIERRKNPPKPFLATKPEPKKEAKVEPKVEAKPEKTAEKEAVKSQLLPMLKKFGLGDVALQIEEGMKAEGSYAASVIKVALDANNPVRVLRHESLHGLKDLGFFTPGQWKVLENQADKTWIDKYLKQRNINGQPIEGGQQSRYEAYMNLYDGDINAVREEAIADAFGDFDVNGAPKGLFATLLKKMQDFFRALRSAFTGAGYETADDVFGKVERGELKAAEPKAEAAPKMSLAESTDAFKADAQTIKAADDYEAEHGIRPYVSEGFLDLPKDGTKYSIQSFNPDKHLSYDAVLGVPINKDGTVTLYYHTTKENAVKISNKKVIPSEGRNRIYLTNESVGADILRDRGNFDQELDGSTILVYAHPDMLQMDDTEYKNGRKDFYIPLAQGDFFNRKMKLQSIQKSRTSAITDVFSYSDHEDKIASAVEKYKNATPAERKKLLSDARKTLKQEHNVSSLLSENGKLEKTRVGEYDLDWEGNSVASMGLGLASAQQISEKVSTCPRSAICEGLCLGETSGGNFMFGGAASEDVGDIQKSSFRAAARMMQYLKTEALVIHPEEFATLLQAEIDSLKKWCASETQIKVDKETKKRYNEAKEIYQPAVRLNVTSDFKPSMFRAIIDGNPGVEFYDYTKLGSESIAKNHHLTYSSTGFGQIVNGEKVFFKDKSGNYDHNWATMRKRLDNGQNVAMAFSSKSGIPSFLQDEETGNTYRVWNGDDYDARFLDPKQPDGKGMIIGLKNKAGNLSEKNATQKTDGFFVKYDPKTDGDTVVVPDQQQFQTKPKKVFEIKPEKLSLREVKGIFDKAENIYEPPGVEAIREQWVGGVSGIGDRNAIYDLYRVGGGKKYTQDVQNFVRKELGDDFKGYRLMSNEELEEIKTGSMGSQFASFTLNPEVARAFKNIPAYAKKTGMSVVEMDLTPEHVAMIGHPGELEFVVDYGQGYNPDEVKVVEKYSLREAPDTSEFKRWFGNSKIVDADGNPKVMYHGTARDITTFKPKQANAIFVTEYPEFAENFTSLGEEYMQKELWNNADHNQHIEWITKATNQAKKDGEITPKEAAKIISNWKDVDGTYGFIPSEIETYVWKALNQQLPSKANIMPLYVKAENPFDYQNPEHVKAVLDELNSQRDSYGLPAGRSFGGIKTGNWELIEKPIVQQAIKKLGHDSFYIKEGGTKNLAVYEPSQVKSATGNIGAYDINNPDVRYSLRTDVAEDIRNMPNGAAIEAAINRTTATRQEVGFVERMTAALAPESWSYLRQKALDRYNRLNDVEKLIATQMGGVQRLADQNAHAAALQSDAAAGVAASALGVGNRIGGIPVYRNGYTTVSNENGTVKGAVEIFSPLAKYGDPKIYQAYQFWAGAKRGKRLLASGKEQLYTPQDMAYAKQLEEKYPEFVSVQKDWIKYNNGLVKYAVDTGVISAQNAEEFTRYSDYIPFYRQIEGEHTVGPNIFQSISGVKAPKKLTGSEAPLADLLETITRNTQSIIQAGMKNVAAQKAVKGGMIIGMVRKMDHVSSGPNSITILENGQKVSYECADKLWVDAVSSLNLPELPFLNFLAKPANFLRAAVTKDPGFMLANLMRDSVSAYVTSGAKLTPVASAVKEMGNVLMNNSPEYQKLLSAGVLGGYEFSRSVEASTEAFEKDLRKKTGTKTGFETAISPLTFFWDKLEKGTEASDAATRIAVYKATLAETGNEAEAIHRALEVMNFNRKGSSAVVRIAAAAIPFLNARIQGLDVFFRAGIRPFMDANATEQEKQVQKAMIIRGMTLLGLSVMYAAAVSGDPDYEKQEEETKDNNWIIPRGEGKTPIKIPIPFEVGTLFKTIPERIYRSYFLPNKENRDTTDDLHKSMMRAIQSTFAINPVPQVVAPLLEARDNYSVFTQRPIVGQNMQSIAPEFQVGPGTSKWAEILGQQAGMSPMMIDHVFKGYTGTMGVYASDLLDAGINSVSPTGVEKPSKRMEQIPIIKRFLADPDARGKITSYFDLKHAVDTTVRTINLLEKQGDPNLPDYVEKNAQLFAARDFMNNLNKQMDDLQKQANMIRAADIPANEKRDMLTEITKAQNLLVNDIRQIRNIIKP